MKSPYTRDLIAAVMVLLSLSEFPARTWAQAIPEPPQLLFGQIYNPAAGPPLA